MKRKLYQWYLDLMARPGIFRLLLSYWPPYFFSGIRVEFVSPDYREIVVKLKQTFYNRNHFGTHFGGSLFAMTDPFFVFMTLHNIGGKKYFVWDKGAEIEFIKPGKGVVRAKMILDQPTIDRIVKETSGGQKYEPQFEANVIDEAGEVVARYRKTIYVRLKPKFRESQTES